MNAKLMFDENFPVKVVKGLVSIASLLAPKVQVAFLPEYVQAFASRDAEWVPALASEGWIIVTADRGKTNSGMKLPRVARAFGVTHVLVGPSMHTLKQIPRLAVILQVWDQLIATTTYPPGTRLRLSVRGGTPHLDVVEVTD